MNTRQLGELIERAAPANYACEWDNTGFNVDLHNDGITDVMVCLDATPEVIREAAKKGCGAIVSHHPLLFREIKRVDTHTFSGECLKELLCAGISLYCAHTSVDSVRGGINTWLADALGLKNQCFLEPESPERYYKLAVSVPEPQAQDVRDALARAGAGKLGSYSHCSFSVRGEGTFRPERGAHPFIGRETVQETVPEVWIQALVSGDAMEEAVAAVRQTHPYETPAIDVFLLENTASPSAGMGVLGDLPRPSTMRGVLDDLKRALEADSIRFHGNLNDAVSRVAVCGGAGGGMAEDAARAGAQLFVTGEIKHNVYVESGIALAEAGHFDTEKCFCAILADGLQKALHDVQYKVTVHVTEHMDRPYIDY